jgi:general secretion pathway protein K
LALGPSRAPARGAVAVLVLVTILLASFLLTAFIRRSGTELLADARAREQRVLRAEAYSALETVLAVLADFRAAEGALRSPAEGWADPLADAAFTPAPGLEATVAFTDESAKLSLPTATAEELGALLEVAGVERNEAGRMARVLHAWMREAPADAAPDLDAPDYTRAEPAYRAARRPLRSWDELAAVELDRRVFFDADGAPTPVVAALGQSASLHEFSRVNLNSAEPGTLAALGFGTAEIKALEDHRSRPRSGGDTGVFRSAADAGAVLGPAAGGERLGVGIEMLRIGVTVRQGALAFRLDAVVATAPGYRPRAMRRAPTEAAPAGAPPPAPVPERKELDYPFTVVEIREGPEPLAAPVAPAS